ncbi:enhancer of mRNA-decapping protein 4 homolog Ge-1 isoform X2 [Rhodnius prolixus]|uniref:enhancer of mRNA-decapping protein 4 homolog Ge-1 isoform X2 n=1 Tax=Rhodnius prolixus TaxID=13249 RepID=UPI003D189C18
MLKVTVHCTAVCCLLLVYTFVKNYFKSSSKSTMSSGILQPVAGSQQTVQFSESEENNSVPIISEDVTVISSTGVHVTGSSKVKMNNIVDYSWEERYYTGQLLAVHRDGKYIAYGIKGAKSNCAIRVVNRETAKRALIKGIEGMIEDLAFAFIPNQVILASLDQFGNVLIHKIQESTVEIVCALILNIKGDVIESEGPKRIFWCPYVPDEEAENSPDPYAEGLLLAVTRGTKIQMWSVNTLAIDPACTSYSGNSPGFLSIDAHSNIIVDAAFSPDGSAIATASHDGKCKFFQAYMHGEGRCLHEWEPHNGEPVTLLFFLDNYTNFENDTQFWKYAVTGAKDNCELKLWSCETWECIQTLRFTSSESHASAAKKLKAAIDLTAGYILLSDMYSRLLYVLELQKNANESLPFVKSISEFKLPYPILSFGIVDAGPKTFKPNTSFNIEDLCNGESEEESQIAVMVRMYLVQPKSLQECHIVFQPAQNNTILQPPQLSSLTCEALEKQERLAEISAGLKDLDLSKTNAQPQPPPPPLNLMTPDAFHSPSNKETMTLIGDTKSTPLPDSSDSYTTSNTALVNNSEVSVVGVGFVSGGSSPSREVQEILSSPCYYVSPRSPQPQQHVMTSQSPNINCVPDTTNNKLKEIEHTINSLKGDMSALTQALQNHSSEIQILREELRLSKANSDNTILKAISEGSLRCGLDQERLASQIIKEVQCAVLSNVLPQVTMEFKNNIKKDVNETLIDLKEIIHTELSQRLTLTDQALKENLQKMVRSKPIVDLLASSLTGAASASMEQLYKDTFVKVAVPLFENACSTMFNQINEALTQGLKEFQKDVKEAELYSTKSNDRTNVELMTMQSASEHLTVTAQQFTNTVDKETKRLNDMVQELQRTVVSANLNNGSMRSGTVTPAFTDPHLLQSQLSKMISQGQIDAAFQQALSASDLSLVMYVCENVPPQKVFRDDGCLLQQHVLLSLIQQLSADMSQHTDIKHRYLEEAVMNLDSSNLNTREHMPVVLRGLHKQLKVFLSANPNSKLSKNVRMLQMATHSLLNS